MTVTADAPTSAKGQGFAPAPTAGLLVSLFCSEAKILLKILRCRLQDLQNPSWKGNGYMLVQRRLRHSGQMCRTWHRCFFAPLERCNLFRRH